MAVSKLSRVYNKPRGSVDSDIYLVGAIEAPEDYLEELQTLREATADEHITIYINSGGGRVDTAVQMLAGIRNSAAKVTCVIEGVCHSAATYIFLAADEWIVNHNSLMLVHNYSGGAYGKGGDLVDNVIANDRWVKNLMVDVYKGFLTDEELDSVVRLNQDIWLETDQINERLQQVVILRQEATLLHEEAMREEVKRKLKELSDETDEEVTS
jgi:ATP-dependent protease ClpP protease subunit|tara:strand:- start:3607 stop:4242 length:636 start_codon:yes stop_codon:yes gene_type:complete